MNDDMKTLELECGVTLKLKPVNKMLLLDYVGEFVDGGKVDPSKMNLRVFNKMMRYISGWGVTNDLPPGEGADYEMFGGVRQQRSAWVREIATEAELSQLMAQCMTLTLPKRKQAPVELDGSEQTELERLRAENKKLEADAKRQRAIQEVREVRVGDELELLQAENDRLKAQKAEDGE